MEQFASHPEKGHEQQAICRLKDDNFQAQLWTWQPQPPSSLGQGKHLDSGGLCKLQCSKPKSSLFQTDFTKRIAILLGTLFKGKVQGPNNVFSSVWLPPTSPLLSLRQACTSMGIVFFWAHHYVLYHLWQTPDNALKSLSPNMLRTFEKNIWSSLKILVFYNHQLFSFRFHFHQCCLHQNLFNNFVLIPSGGRKSS